MSRTTSPDPEAQLPEAQLLQDHDGSAPDGSAHDVPGDGSTQDATRRTDRLGSFGIVAVSVVAVVLAAWILLPKEADTPASASLQTVDVAAGGVAPRVGDAAPDFTATDIHGEPVSLSDFEGDPVWLTFGATWCAACRAEAPDIQAAYVAAQDRGAEVIEVYLSEDAEAVQAYTERVGADYVHVPDPRTEIASQYAVVGIPTHYFIDREGNVAAIRVGVLTREQMDAELDAIS